MEFNTILHEIRDNAAHITLNRPDRLNAMTLEMATELQHAFRLAAADDSVRAVAITGAGRAFSTGHDLGSPRKSSPDDPREPLRDYYNPMIQLLRDLPLPTVAVVNGPCAGASIGLALACDMVIAGQSAYFLPAFVNIGLIPDSGVSSFFTARLGAARATALLMMGERINAEAAEQWGLIWKCVADDELAAEAASLMDKLSSGPTRTYAAIKQLTRSAGINTLSAQMQLEAETQARVRLTEDAQEAKQAFLDRRKPVFTGK